MGVGGDLPPSLPSHPKTARGLLGKNKIKLCSNLATQSVGILMVLTCYEPSKSGLTFSVLSDIRTLLSGKKFDLLELLDSHRLPLHLKGISSLK